MSDRIQTSQTPISLSPGITVNHHSEKLIQSIDFSMCFRRHTSSSGLSSWLEVSTLLPCAKVSLVRGPQTQPLHSPAGGSDKLRHRSNPLLPRSDSRHGQKGGHPIRGLWKKPAERTEEERERRREKAVLESQGVEGTRTRGGA